MIRAFKEWPPALLMAAVCLVVGFVAFAIGIGYLFGPGWGWLAFALGLLLFAKQSHEIYQEEKEQAKERQL